KKELYDGNGKLNCTIIHASQKSNSPTYDAVVNALLNYQALQLFTNSNPCKSVVATIEMRHICKG
ncbi:hypothetical protein KI387_037238, partial [Taxus chinensis]